MSARRLNMKIDPGRELLPILLLLLLAVIVPTVCVLWFMGQAVRNERLAVRQKLTEMFATRLVEVRKGIEGYWKQKAAELSVQATPETAGQVFTRLIAAKTADSVLVFDRTGKRLYPRPSEPGPEPADFPLDLWEQAEQLEYEKNSPESAALKYARIAQAGRDTILTARARQAQVRCLAKAGLTREATRVLMNDLNAPKFHDAADAAGRLIVPDVQLFFLQSIDPASAKTLALLVGRLKDYTDSNSKMPSDQRRFLMEQVKQLHPQTDFPTLAAEDLAATYLQKSRPKPEAEQLSPAIPNEIWQLPSPDRTVVGLFRRETILATLAPLMKGQGINIALSLTNARPEREPFYSLPMGDRMPDWQLNVFLDSGNPFSAAADRQIAIYLWTAVLVIALIAILATLMVRTLVRQVRLTRLKNNFLATVSHELKTPLASMRVLVDTLLEGHIRDEKQGREYLELIGKENERLSRLIDNFLTFSRMERNKRSFEFTDASPDQIVRTAVETIRDRFEAAGCKLSIEIAPDLPTIVADRDAMVTVLLNLLDNAYKYSENEKQITLRSYLKDGRVFFEVEDRGIGLSRRDRERIFGRFYQVDQSLSRKTGGCGLGLSIVKFIVEAHGGTIDVNSQSGKGSRFTVSIPQTTRM